MHECSFYSHGGGAWIHRGEVKSTAPYRPFSHIVLGNHVCRSEARKAERYFKSGFGRKAIDHLLKHYGPP